MRSANSNLQVRSQLSFVASIDLLSSSALLFSPLRPFVAVQHYRYNKRFRGSTSRGSGPKTNLTLNVCRPLSMRVSGIFRQGFRIMPEVCTSAGPYSCWYQGFTFSPCSKEHCRGLNPCMHLHIRAPQTAVNPNLMASTASGHPHLGADTSPISKTIKTFHH
jgi:hypothetical protein